jgi:hypothetical protein
VELAGMSASDCEASAPVAALLATSKKQLTNIVG